jgi:hypothetical protein
VLGVIAVVVIVAEGCWGAPTRASSVAARSRWGMTTELVGVLARGVVVIELSADMSVSLAPGVELCDERSMSEPALSDGLGDTSIASSYTPNQLSCA